MTILKNLDEVITVLSSAMAGASGIFSLGNILNYANQRAAVLQTELSKVPEVTKQVYESAMDVVNSTTPNEALYTAGLAGAVSTIFAGVALYKIIKLSKNEIKQ